MSFKRMRLTATLQSLKIKFSKLRTMYGLVFYWLRSTSFYNVNT